MSANPIEKIYQALSKPNFKLYYSTDLKIKPISTKTWHVLLSLKLTESKEETETQEISNKILLPWHLVLKFPENFGKVGLDLYSSINVSGVINQKKGESIDGFHGSGELHKIRLHEFFSGQREKATKGKGKSKSHEDNRVEDSSTQPKQANFKNEDPDKLIYILNKLLNLVKTHEGTLKNQTERDIFIGKFKGYRMRNIKLINDINNYDRNSALPDEKMGTSKKTTDWTIEQDDSDIDTEGQNLTAEANEPVKMVSKSNAKETEMKQKPEQELDLWKMYNSQTYKPRKAGSGNSRKKRESAQKNKKEENKKENDQRVEKTQETDSKENKKRRNRKKKSQGQEVNEQKVLSEKKEEKVSTETKVAEADDKPKEKRKRNRNRNRNKESPLKNSLPESSTEGPESPRNKEKEVKSVPKSESQDQPEAAKDKPKRRRNRNKKTKQEDQKVNNQDNKEQSSQKEKPKTVNKPKVDAVKENDAKIDAKKKEDKPLPKRKSKGRKGEEKEEAKKETKPKPQQKQPEKTVQAKAISTTVEASKKETTKAVVQKKTEQKKTEQNDKQPQKPKPNPIKPKDNTPPTASQQKIFDMLKLRSEQSKVKPAEVQAPVVPVVATITSAPKVDIKSLAEDKNLDSKSKIDMILAGAVMKTTQEKISTEKKPETNQTSQENQNQPLGQRKRKPKQFKTISPPTLQDKIQAQPLVDQLRMLQDKYEKKKPVKKETKTKNKILEEKQDDQDFEAANKNLAPRKKKQQVDETGFTSVPSKNPKKNTQKKKKQDGGPQFKDNVKKTAISNKFAGL